MLRNNSANNTTENTFDDGQGLGPHLVGKQLEIKGRTVSICKQLGEGGFSFVYLVRDAGSSIERDEGSSVGPQHIQNQRKSKTQSQPAHGTPMVLKITAVHTTAQRLMAEKEAKLLQTLSHPSIVQVYDDGFRDPTGAEDGNDTDANASSNIEQNNPRSNSNRSLQHLILMEYCEGGTAFDAIKRMRASPSENTRFDLPSLVIAFGQICNAVSYLHAQRPPIIHRDLKPVNFLIKNGAYKLCDFGSAVLGHTDLRTAESRRKAEEVVGKTTTQMFRAPEMVDLYMSKRLTQSTDVWALGCCLYSLAFLRDCFEEGSNLAILSKKYKIPEDNPYGGGVVDLIDRMLTVDYKERADMSEVIMCLSALYSNRELPKRKKRSDKKEGEEEAPAGVGGNSEGRNEVEADAPRVGTYRTDGQGIRRMGEASPTAKEKKVLEAKKLNPNSAAAKRKKASETNKQKESSLITPSQLSGTAGGKKSSASASTRSETPISDSGDFGNFASFDQVFEDNFDPFQSSHEEAVVELNSLMDKINGSDQDFSSAFADHCEISQECASIQLPGPRISDNELESSFEVTFQGFDSSVPSVFSTDDHYFSNVNNANNDDGFGDTMANQDEQSKQIAASPKKFFGFGSGSSNNEAPALTISAKKKRGVFGMLGKR